MTASQRPTELEIASGVVHGEDPSALALPDVDRTMAPVEALEAATVPALRRPPCVVTFSGGRDSSVVLAAAVRAARREGLDLPVPVTLVSPGYAEADESAWQEMVVRYLGLSDWQRVEVVEERDLLGPVAREVLRRNGVLEPFGVYTHVPPLELAAGGSLLTGEDGDGLFEGWDFARAVALATARARPERRDVLRLAKAALPGRLRYRVQRRFRPARFAWLRPAALEQVRHNVAVEQATEPRRWDRWVDWWSRRRYIALMKAGFNTLGADLGTTVLHPLWDPAFLVAVAQRGGRTGFGDRRRAMRALFSGLVPDALLARTDKADFSRLGWGKETYAFTQSWRGGGVPADLVDEEALRREWAEPIPDARTVLLLHSAWLASSTGDHAEKPLDGIRH